MNNDVYIVLWIVQHANFQEESVGAWADEHVEVLSLEDRHIRSAVRMQDVGDADAVTMRRWTDFGSRRLPAHRRATYERSMRAASYFPRDRATAVAICWPTVRCRRMGRSATE